MSRCAVTEAEAREARRVLRRHGFKPSAILPSPADFAPDHLYVIQSEDRRHFKIGRSYLPSARLRSLQTACPLRLLLVMVVQGEGNREADIHAALASCRGLGEWFSGEKVRSFVEALLAGMTCDAALAVSEERQP